MNVSVNATPPSNVTIYTYPELVFFAVCFSIMIIVTVVGNSLVLVAVARTKKLQNVTNVFVVNLSVSDCLTSFALLWSVPGMVSTTPGYPLQSDVPCVVAAALVFISVGCGLNTLANIAVNRCIVITRPKETYQWLYKPKKIALMVLGSWLIPLCAAIIPPLSGVGGLGFDPESRTCTDIIDRPKASTYDTIQLALYYPLPFSVTVVSYVLICRHVRRHFKKRRHEDIGLQSSSATPSASLAASRQEDSSIHADENLRSRHAALNREELAITKNLFVVVVAFLLCFSPICITVASGSTGYKLYTGMFVFVSGCINPFIYANKHPHFRPVLRSMIRCRCLKE